MKWNKVVWVVMSVFFWGIGIQALRAGDMFEAAPDDYIKTRTYAGGFGTSANIDSDGDFNNSLLFSHDYSGNIETDLIPAITRNFGFGGLLGYRTGAWALEVSFWASEHNSTWSDRLLNPGSPTTFFGTASYQSINIDFKRYLFTKFPTQPFFSLGLSFPWVVARDASLLDDGGIIVTDDATISGLGFNLGAGLEIYLGKDFSILGGVTERFSGFNQINGAAKQSENVLTFTGTLADQASLAGNGFNFYVGATAGFE